MPRNARAASHESRRDAASRALAEALGPVPEYEVPEVRADCQDLTSADPVSVSHPLAKWGEVTRRRRHMRLLGLKLRPMSIGAGARLLDVHAGRLNGMRLSWNFEDAGDLGNGMSRVLPHNGFKAIRTTRAWVDDPRGGAIRCIEADQLRPNYISAGVGGLLSERRAKQLQFSSCFDVLWANAHAGAGTTTEDSASLFDQTPNGLAGSFRRVILTAGNPHGSDGVQPYPATRAAAGGGILTVSLYHHDDPGATLNWRLVRGSDGNYWNEGTGAWQAGTVNNPLALVKTSPGLQIASRRITSSATTYTFVAVQPSGGTVSRVNRIHLVQIEEGKRFQSSPIAFDRSYGEVCPGFRDDDLYQVANEIAARVFIVERGTMFFRGVPKWSTADLDGLRAHVFAVEYDANNSVALYFDGINSTKDRLVLDVRAGGVTVTTAATVAVTRDTEIKVGMRWASSTYSELADEYAVPASGNARYDVWFGSSIVFSVEAAMPTETAGSRVQIMCRDGENFDGIGEDFQIVKEVYTAEEMVAAL